MKKIIFLILLSVVSIPSAMTQQVEISGVRNREFRGVQAILDPNGEATGYFTFYVNEKVGRGMVEFNLEIFNLELERIRRTPIQITKRSVLLGGEFNGNDFLFAFADYGKKLNTFITMNRMGEIIKQEEQKNRKLATAGSTQVFPDQEGDGFYVTRTIKEKRWGFSIEKVDRDLRQVWEKTFTRNRGVTGVSSVETGRGKVIAITSERPNTATRKIISKLVCMSSEDGSLLFEYDMNDGEDTGVPTAFLIDNEQNIVTSGMYFQGIRTDQANSDGIFFLKLSPSGKRLAYSKIDWENGIQETLKATSRKFSIGSKPKVIFHEIVQSPDGAYQTVAETFRKTVKAGTILGLLGNANEPPPMGFTVMDMIVFNFTNDGKPIDINKIEKPYKSIYIDGSIASVGGVALANYVKRFGMFTFNFCTVLPESGKQVVVYTNFDNKGASTGKPYVGVTSIEIGEESETNKIPLAKKLASFLSGGDPDGDMTGALKSHPGKVCIYYFNRKARNIVLALEDLELE
jgi:hypothetical protein